ncbi:MAG: hypothetical protein SWZ49_27400 [Cyanobacteriota bacterium]|nr:hypothetical protein [Cyanobacteriota bacterium]
MTSNILNLNEHVFTIGHDVVNPHKTIFNPAHSTVKTLRGRDQIIGSSSLRFNLGVSVEVAAEAIGQGSNPVNSTEFRTQSKLNIDGIINRGNIYTNKGRDIVSGTATAQITAIAQTVSEAIAIANTVDATAVANSLASVEIAAVANGIQNSGTISTGAGSDTVIGEAEASVAAVATAIIDVTAIVSAVAQNPMSEGLTAVALGFATSLAQAKVVATGINNECGEIKTGSGADNISATATSYSATYAEAELSAVSIADPENKALALTVVEAIARTEDVAIAIDNKYGHIRTGYGADTITATANASDKAIAIYNKHGAINTGYGVDVITGVATGSESYGIYGGKIRTGYGADTLDVRATGSQSYAIYDSEIRTGYGADTITAFATGSESYGIYGGKIRTGYGDDTVKASNFGGGANIKTGYGKDYVEGFGEATIYGGEDFDTLNLGSYSRSDFNIYANHDFTVFELGDTTMITSEFEQYIFADGDYSSHNLIV